MFVADILWMPTVEEKHCMEFPVIAGFFTPIKSREPLRWRNPEKNPSKNTYILYWFAVKYIINPSISHFFDILYWFAGNCSAQIHPSPQRTGVRTWDLYLEGRPRSSDWFLVPLIIYIILFFQLWGCVSVSLSLSLSLSLCLNVRYVRYVCMYVCMYVCIYIYWVCM